MPAAAVIPAPIAYIKVVAVKASVVEFQMAKPLLQFTVSEVSSFLVGLRSTSVTLSKLECSKQALA